MGQLFADQCGEHRPLLGRPYRNAVGQYPTPASAALAQWHLDQGFPNPTKAKVFRGIQVLYPALEKRAKPLQIEQLARVDQWPQTAIGESKSKNDRRDEIRHLHNRALLLLGIWCGFHGDEMTQLRAEHVEIVPGQGMTSYFPVT